MLNVYNNVQEEVKYKTKLYEKEKEQNRSLQNEVNDLQREFEQDREEYLDTIRKQERQTKLLTKILYRLQPLIPNDCNYFNLERVQANSVWNDQNEDWILPELKIEKLSLPSMNQQQQQQHQQQQQQQQQQQRDKDNSLLLNTNSNNNLDLYSGGSDNDDYDLHPSQQQQQQNHRSEIAASKQQILLQGRRNGGGSRENNSSSATTTAYMMQSREPEVDKYRIKLENSQFDGSNYFKTKRQSQLLNQTQSELKNAGRLSPLGNSNATTNAATTASNAAAINSLLNGGRAPNRRPY
jgi:hypothetical protein